MDYMRQALKQTPQYEMPMPPDVVSLGGELYFDTFLPGQGFVHSVGITESAAHADAHDNASAGGEGEPGERPAAPPVYELGAPSQPVVTQ
jgi:penicillin-binding protein 1A